MRKLTKFISILLVMSIALSLVATGFVFADDEKTTVTYEFTGENKDDAGFAEGIIKITKGDDCDEGNYYGLFFGDENGMLENYKQIMGREIVPGTVEFDMPRKMLIPEGATRIMVYELEYEKIEDSEYANYICSFDIPEAKRYSEGKTEIRFASLSDLHLNYQWAGEKWYRALCYFKEIGIDLIAISGDYTNDGGTEHFDMFQNAVEESGYNGKIWGCIGNHDTGNKSNYLLYLSDYCTDGDKLYFYKVADNGDVFIFLAQDKLTVIGESHTQNCFSDEQMDWLENLLETYSNTGVNIFIYEHANFYNWGAGDFIPGVYVQPMNIGEDFKNNTRLMALLYEYKEVIELSGHTHVAFSQFRNFDDNNGTSARTVHNSSVSQIRVINSNRDGLVYNTNEVESEGYIVTVYEDYVVFRGMDLASHKYIPAACYIMESYSADHSETENVKSISINEELSAKYSIRNSNPNDMKLVLDVTMEDGTVVQVDKGYNVLCFDLSDVLMADSSKLSDEVASVIVFYGGKSVKYVPFVIENNYLSELHGKGTKEEPYLIASAYDFYCFTKATETMISGGTDYLSVITEKYYFRQTADIDMRLLDEKYKYEGNCATKLVSYNFAGVYDGDGHTLIADISSESRGASVFPYVSGLIINLNLTGTIKLNGGEASIQPIRYITEDGAVVNCVFDFAFENGKPSALSTECKGKLINCYVTAKKTDETVITSLTDSEDGLKNATCEKLYCGFENKYAEMLEYDSALKEISRYDEEMLNTALSAYGYSASDLKKWKEADDSGLSTLYLILIIVAAILVLAAIVFATKKTAKKNNKNLS